jgi:hypothetical protein
VLPTPEAPKPRKKEPSRKHKNNKNKKKGPVDVPAEDTGGGGVPGGW